MTRTQEQHSEVTHLLAQIKTEYEAAKLGLVGLAYGTSHHDFITKRMEHMGQLHKQLQRLVGDTAIALVADQLNKCHQQRKS